MTDKTDEEEVDLGLLADMPRTHADSVRKLADAMLRYALWPAIAVVVAGITVGTLVAGVEGSLGALVGGVVAFASSLGTLWLMRRTAAFNPMLLMGAALGGFIAKMLILLVVMLLLGNVGFLHKESLAFTMLAVVVVWAAMDMIAFRRTKIPTLIIDSDGDTTTSRSSS
jgi:ATP synthase protein I